MRHKRSLCFASSCAQTGFLTYLSKSKTWVITYTTAFKHVPLLHDLHCNIQQLHQATLLWQKTLTLTFVKMIQLSFFFASVTNFQLSQNMPHLTQQNSILVHIFVPPPQCTTSMSLVTQSRSWQEQKHSDGASPSPHFRHQTVLF